MLRISIKNILYRILIRLSFRLSSANLFISSDQYRQITSHIVVNNPIVVRSSLVKLFDLPPSIDDNNECSSELSINNQFVFLSVLWQTHDQFKRKGLWETLEAISLLKNGGFTDFKWIVAGKHGDATEELLTKIRILGLTDHVSVLLNITQDKKHELYAQSDLYIQPSWCEGFGNASLEAMSYGLPALVSRYTAQPESVGNTGLIVLDVTPENILEKLNYFISLGSKERLSLSRSAYDRAHSEFFILGAFMRSTQSLLVSAVMIHPFLLILLIFIFMCHE